jgi:diguanylate cyclase (GGDEF)-like protein
LFGIPGIGVPTPFPSSHLPTLLKKHYADQPMTENLRNETEVGLAEFASRLKSAGVDILKQNKMPHREAIYLAIGNSHHQTDITLSREFLDDLPNTKQFQDAVDSYAKAVSGRLKCGSPEVFYCISGIAVWVSILWPIQSAASTSGLSRFVLMDVTNQVTHEIAKCSIQLGFTLGQTVFDTVFLTVQSVRTAVDQGQIQFYKASVHQEIYQRIDRDEGPTARKAQSEVERFIAGKAYVLGFLVADTPGEIWTTDPWDASYLGVSRKELLLAARTLRAKGLVEPGSGEEYARPTDKLLAEQSSEPEGEQSFHASPQAVSRLNLPTKDTLLSDLRVGLKRHPVSAVLVIDLDNFKSVNDKNDSHSVGDACLDLVVATIAFIIGRRGKLYRWGGDEFAAHLPDFSTDEALVTAERIRSAVEQARPGGDIPVTTSIGICATDHTSSKSAEEILDLADKAMYASKHSGKNRVTAWPIAS